MISLEEKIVEHTFWLDMLLCNLIYEDFSEDSLREFSARLNALYDTAPHMGDVYAERFRLIKIVYENYM